MFWAGCICLFPDSCHSGNQHIIFVDSNHLCSSPPHTSKRNWGHTHLSLNQGVKKVHYKKKFHSTSCCWASTFYTASDVSLMLLFTNGKVEIRWWSYFSLWFMKWIIPKKKVFTEWMSHKSSQCFDIGIDVFVICRGEIYFWKWSHAYLLNLFVCVI